MYDQLIQGWHAADTSLWDSQPETFEDALAKFCAATDAVVGRCDADGLVLFGNPVSTYKEAILTALRLQGKDVIAEMLRERGLCLDALNRLSRLPPDPLVRTDGQVPGKPNVYLLNWDEVLRALDLKNDSRNRKVVTDLVKRHAGPLKLPGKGGQPKGEYSALIEWWNGLKQRFEEVEQRKQNQDETLKEAHLFGRGGTVFPQIGGAEKRRREKG
jgi:hypothetical protein